MSTCKYHLLWKTIEKTTHSLYLQNSFEIMKIFYSNFKYLSPGRLLSLNFDDSGREILSSTFQRLFWGFETKQNMIQVVNHWIRIYRDLIHKLIYLRSFRKSKHLENTFTKRINWLVFCFGATFLDSNLKNDSLMPRHL